jgi:hypothetical protein
MAKAAQTEKRPVAVDIAEHPSRNPSFRFSRKTIAGTLKDDHRVNCERKISCGLSMATGGSGAGDEKN